MDALIFSIRKRMADRILGMGDVVTLLNARKNNLTRKRLSEFKRE